MSEYRVVSARIRWQLPKEGGRNTLPSNTRYITVGLFYTPAGKQFEDGWSTIVESQTLLNSSQILLVSISLLADEQAPAGILNVGNHFELTEGAKIVAKGEILTSLNGTYNGQLQHTMPVLMTVE